MSSQIGATFARLRDARRCGLVAYVTAGDPDAARSREILLALDRAGADLIEVGVPFSEPLADGPVIQRASERALAAGMTLGGTLDIVADIRPQLRTPIVLFTYANPILRFGSDRFVRRATDAGVDGVLVLDLPVEEAEWLRRPLAAAGIDTIFLLSPTTTPERIRRAGEVGSGFLYAISRLGVTGARAQMAAGVRTLIERIRQEATLPIAVGFGISHPVHIAEIATLADAAVVGSALVEVIAQRGALPSLIADVENYVHWLRGERAQSLLPGAQAAHG
jgi:tryptophan synthase alpha chain